jgi:membrane dipeptidase
MMSLQHFFDNQLGGSLHGQHKQGLTEFGRQVVKKIVDKGIMLDLSHSSEQVVRDVLAITDTPVLISHTGFKGHCDSPRNISDDLMVAIARRDGVIGVGYWEAAVCGTSPSDIAAAIAYGVGLVGEDHVALGSDFDGAVTTGFDSSELVLITQALLNAGIDKAVIEKVMGVNVLRFIAAALPPA